MSTRRTQDVALFGCVLRGVPIATGALEALLVARLLARLLAARPDNPAIQILYALTDPLVMPLQALDAQQPQFGAVLELSTLMLLVVVPVVGYILWYVVALQRGKTHV
jgi:uncharacterized protein YggT (Ycf19 family)